MPHRHTIYLKRVAAGVTPEKLLEHLKPIDFWTLGEDYNLEGEAVNSALPVLIKNIHPGSFTLYHLFYGKADKRPVEIHRWASEEVHHGAVEETLENLTIADKARIDKISDFLRHSVDSVSVAFGTDPPAAMFAWEIVRYFASRFDGIIDADDGEWLRVGSDYQAKPV